MTGLRAAGAGSTHSKHQPSLLIGPPQDFRQISSIIDVDILPESHRRVRLHKHGTHKPLGFYIRDGLSVRVTPQGVEKVSSGPHLSWSWVNPGPCLVLDLGQSWFTSGPGPHMVLVLFWMNLLFLLLHHHHVHQRWFRIYQ